MNVETSTKSSEMTIGRLVFGPAAETPSLLPENRHMKFPPPAATQARATQPAKGYVVGWCFDPTLTYVALIRKNRPAWQAGKLNGIGGKIEQNERRSMAMVREFKEEAGLLTHEMDWLHFRTEFFNSGQESVRAQQTGAKVHHFAYQCNTDSEWDKIHTCTDEEIKKVSARMLTTWWGEWEMIYNLPYLIPMARIMLQQPPENRPLP